MEHWNHDTIENVEEFNVMLLLIFCLINLMIKELLEEHLPSVIDTS
jgi:hypothetical protein